MRVKFTVAGEPGAKGRPKFSTAGKYARAYTPEKTVNYENLVKLMYAEQCKNYRFHDDAQLDLKVIAYFPIPKSTSKKKRQLMIDKKIRPTAKRDWDNIGKVVSDALNEIAYKDDKQIVDGLVRKFYSEEPRVVVIIQEV